MGWMVLLQQNMSLCVCVFVHACVCVCVALEIVPCCPSHQLAEHQSVPVDSVVTEFPFLEHTVDSTSMCKTDCNHNDVTMLAL